MISPSKSAIAISENDHQRSDFVRGLVQKPCTPLQSARLSNHAIPRRIVQFWDNPDRIPQDVRNCLDSWHQLEALGFERLLFNDRSARVFIAKALSAQHVEAYEKCYHPAMKSDYFRLCFLLSQGGCYIDADDACCGTKAELLFADDRLKLQPLCYSIDTDSMVESALFTQPGELLSSNHIFYFNNNPIAASAENPVVSYALARATRLLAGEITDELPEIQSTTGPGNLTASLVAHAATDGSYGSDRLVVLSDWESYARTIWPLSYRKDTRNWRLSNRRRFTLEL